MPLFISTYVQNGFVSNPTPHCDDKGNAIRKERFLNEHCSRICQHRAQSNQVTCELGSISVIVFHFINHKMRV